ncbi:MAG: MjaI family restriction endonuclease [Clostridia bacterium]
MAKNEIKRYSMEFGKKEKVLNYACQTYQLSRPNKVGAVMALIRECQPQTIDEWEKWYFENAMTANKKAEQNFKISRDDLNKIGIRLYDKIIAVVIPEWQAIFAELTEQDCIDYIYNLTINRTYDGFIREKSIVNDNLAKTFREVSFEESDSDLDHAGDVDYIARINNKAFGIQIKPITAKSNFSDYSLTERMQSNFESFKEKYGGKVFIVFCDDGVIKNQEVVEEIQNEIERLKRN